MQIAFDSSTLILLAKTGLLDLFLDGFPGNAIISKTVEWECMAKQTPDAQLIRNRIDADRISVKPIRDRKVRDKLEKDFNINAGETETLILAIQFKTIVATDDWNAIQACKILKLPFTSALGILTRLKEKRIIDRKSSLAKLDALANYGRYADEIIQTVRKKLEE